MMAIPISPLKGLVEVVESLDSRGLIQGSWIREESETRHCVPGAFGQRLESTAAVVSQLLAEYREAGRRVDRLLFGFDLSHLLVIDRHPMELGILFESIETIDEIESEFLNHTDGLSLLPQPIAVNGFRAETDPASSEQVRVDRSLNRNRTEVQCWQEFHPKFIRLLSKVLPNAQATVIVDRILAERFPDSTPNPLDYHELGEAVLQKIKIKSKQQLLRFEFQDLIQNTLGTKYLPR